MVATLARSGTGSFSVNNLRSYDAWGNIRAGSSTGDPKNRYCASLGHQADDESGLVYMRARYFESTSGRFIREDPSRSGTNWFAYCGNDPVQGVDQSGKYTIDSGILARFTWGMGLSLGIICMMSAWALAAAGNIEGAVIALGAALAFGTIAMSQANGISHLARTVIAYLKCFSTLAVLTICAAALGAAAKLPAIEAGLVFFNVAYTLTLLSYLAFCYE